jgi:hypothetical protein
MARTLHNPLAAENLEKRCARSATCGLSDTLMESWLSLCFFTRWTRLSGCTVADINLRSVANLRLMFIAFLLVEPFVSCTPGVAFTHFGAFFPLFLSSAVTIDLHTSKLLYFPLFPKISHGSDLHRLFLMAEPNDNWSAY